MVADGRKHFRLVVSNDELASRAESLSEWSSASKIKPHVPTGYALLAHVLGWLQHCANEVQMKQAR